MTHITPETVSLLARYFRAFKEDWLFNEPARLLCQYIDEEKPLGGADPMEAAIAALFRDVDLDVLGSDGRLGGVVVARGIARDYAEYGHGEGFCPLTASQLLELAMDSGRTGKAAPVPGWYDEARKGMTCAAAQACVEELGWSEIVSILAAQKTQVRIRDGVPEFYAGWRWTDNPKSALFELLEEVSCLRRAEILCSG